MAATNMEILKQATQITLDKARNQEAILREVLEKAQAEYSNAVLTRRAMEIQQSMIKNVEEGRVRLVDQAGDPQGQ